MDKMVLETQQWLNQVYGGDSRFNRLTENGKTGWTTIYGLIRALQIELGISATADSFGPSTQSKFVQRWPNGISQQNDSDQFESNVYGIIQGALWCKGYSTGSAKITRHFYSGTGAGIKKLKTDMGISSNSSNVSLDIMKALLSMDQFVLIKGYNASSAIRRVQQQLNQTYFDYVGIIPCDGLYGRSMNKALIKVLQAVEGLSPSDATGTFGNTTKARLPILPLNNASEAIRLFRYCLLCNGYYNDTTLAGWDTSLEALTIKFQNDHILPVTGQGDVNTWMSLLLSKGNTDRGALACDCSTILNEQQAQALYNAGYRYVGRYLTGTVGGTRSKAMTPEEIQNIFNSGLRIFAIYQTGVPSLSRYSLDRGIADAEEALKAAKKLGIPKGEYIYFAIDYDIMDGEVDTHIFPYFKGIRSKFVTENFPYKIGVYGARNICTRLYNTGLAMSSFVSDMSTGFSGNMGFPMPRNWAFDQFHEYTFSNSGGAFGLDKVAYSGRYNGFGTVEEYVEDTERIIGLKELELHRDFILGALNINTISDFVPVVGKAKVLEQDYEIPIDKNFGFRIHLRAGLGADIKLSNDYKIFDQEIKDGVPEDFVWWSDIVKLAKDFELEATLGISLDEVESLEAALAFTQEIKNGSISYGIKYDVVKAEYTLAFLSKKQYVAGRDDSWTFVEIEITIDGDRLDQMAQTLSLASVLSRELKIALEKLEMTDDRRLKMFYIFTVVGIIVLILIVAASYLGV